MEKPIIRLGPKEFLSGIAQGAHDVSRLWYKADGLNPISDAASGANANSGLLMVGAAGVTISGIVDTPIAGTTTFAGGVSTALVLGDDGHFYKMQIDSPSVESPTPGSDSFTDLRSGTPITNPRAGLEVLDCGGSVFAFYFQSTQIGRATQDAFLGNDTYPTGWTDNWKTSSDDVESDSIRTPHRFNDGIYYANREYIGVISNDGTTTPAHDGHALDLPSGYRALAITDDGTYLVIVCCENNLRYGSRARTRVLFWDTYSSSWIREYSIPEPYVSGAVNIAGIPYCIARNGVWRTSISGPKRVLSRKPRIYQSQTRGNKAQGVYGEALVWGGSTPSGNKALHILGKLDDSMPSTYLTPVLVGSDEISFLSADVYEGYVLVGSIGDNLKAYPLAGGTPQTGVTAQTVYFPLEFPTDISRVVLTFAEPLASGDSVSVSLRPDEDTTATTFGTASFTSDGAIRRKSCPQSLLADCQVSIGLTFTSGTPKIKGIEIYGKQRTP